jgi:hypothetical protein
VAGTARLVSPHERSATLKTPSARKEYVLDTGLRHQAENRRSVRSGEPFVMELSLA